MTAMPMGVPCGWLSNTISDQVDHPIWSLEASFTILLPLSIDNAAPAQFAFKSGQFQRLLFLLYVDAPPVLAGVL